MKILYVEDEFAHVMLAERTLADNLQQEFNLIHAETMKEALEILSAQPDIDLVLSDLRLPDGTGLELLKKIQESKSPPAVVLVTGQGDQEVVEGGVAFVLPVILLTKARHHPGRSHGLAFLGSGEGHVEG